MTPDEFIDQAIRRGEKEGVGALDPIQRLVFLISEAECNCDMEGIDTFLDRLGVSELDEAERAFAKVGAAEIADGLRAISQSSKPTDDQLLSRVNEAITQRRGYDYEAIRRVVEKHLAKSE